MQHCGHSGLEVQLWEELTPSTFLFPALCCSPGAAINGIGIVEIPIFFSHGAKFHTEVGAI